jgi:hypothetical protein
MKRPKTVSVMNETDKDVWVSACDYGGLSVAISSDQYTNSHLGASLVLAREGAHVLLQRCEMRSET